MKKNFSKIEIAVIKRTAQNVAQFVTKKAKIDAKIAELEEEKASLQPIIDSFQGPIKEMTGGYTTEDLVNKETVHTGKIDPKTGKEIIQTRFTLKFPETVVPLDEYDEEEESVFQENGVQESTSEPEVEENEEQETFESPMTEVGNDFDLDKKNAEASEDPFSNDWQ